MKNNSNCHIHIVIGKNFGDEGKGLAVDYFAMRAQREGLPCLVIRHNGGAQAGHTVDWKGGGREAGGKKVSWQEGGGTSSGSRFVFHQLSAGSLRGADTYWAETFLPDLYKLPEEVEAFAAFCRQYGIGRNGAAGASPGGFSSAGASPGYFSLTGDRPGIQIFASANCCCVCVDDVLLNMALETVRGAARHGSCGMGINESVLRSAAQPDMPFRITLGEVKGGGAESLFAHLLRNRREYLPERIRELEKDLSRSGIELDASFLLRSGEYGELLQDENVLYGAAEAMCRNAELVELKEAKEVLPVYRELIFEGAQGLLLDETFRKYAPYLTTSRTGLHNPAAILGHLKSVPESKASQAAPVAEVVYVSRTYVTRHGAGPLPYEGLFDPVRYGIHDLTNQPNEWQGSLRFGPHGSPEEFVREVREDLKAGEACFGADFSGSRFSSVLFLTHLGETGGMVCSIFGNKPVEMWCQELHVRETFQNYYFSATPFAEDVG